ncbi:MAG: M15 family metallopeptidase [Erysipelotrichaceae bacterium]|nr:M15 family metallopeptidase [Erysipelotrichaceae bacterium]
MLLTRRKCFIIFMIGLQFASFIYPHTIIPKEYSKQTRSFIHKHHLYAIVSQYPYSSFVDEMIQRKEITKDMIESYLSSTFDPKMIIKLQATYQSQEILAILQYCNPDEALLLTQIRKIDQIESWLSLSDFELSRYARYIWYQQKYPDLTKTQICLAVNRDEDYITKDKLDYASFYQQLQPCPNPESIQALVNKQWYLSSTYIPDDLVYLPYPYVQNQQPLRQEAANAMIEMLDDAKQQQYTIKAASNYRSYDLQDYLYQYYTRLYHSKIADTISCRPGHSEHQTGLTSDLAEAGKRLEDFESAKGYSWILEHAHEYGFIQRYPKDKEYITGISFEAWHFRYVGKDIANIIQRYQWTLEEYSFFFSN